MATKRAAPPADVEARPTSAELHDAIDRWGMAEHLARVAREEEESARRTLVDILHRLGLKGFSL